MNKATRNGVVAAIAVIAFAGCLAKPSAGSFVELRGRAVAADASAVPGIPVYLVAADRSVQRTKTDAEGRFAFDAQAGNVDLVINDGAGRGNLRRLALDRSVLDVGDVLVESLAHHPRLATLQNVDFEERITNGPYDLKSSIKANRFAVGMRMSPQGATSILAVGPQATDERVWEADGLLSLWGTFLDGRVLSLDTLGSTVLLDVSNGTELYRGGRLSMREWDERLWIIDQDALTLNVVTLDENGVAGARTSDVPAPFFWVEPWRTKAPLLAYEYPGALYLVDGDSLGSQKLMMALPLGSLHTTPDGTRLLSLVEGRLSVIDLSTLAQTTLAEGLDSDARLAVSPTGLEVAVYGYDHGTLHGVERIAVDGASRSSVAIESAGEGRVHYLPSGVLRLEYLLDGGAGEPLWRVSDVDLSGNTSVRDFPTSWSVDFSSTDREGNPRVVVPPRVILLEDGATELVEAVEPSSGVRHFWAGSLGTDFAGMRRLTFMASDHYYLGEWPDSRRVVYTMNDPIDGGFELFEVQRHE